MNKAALALILLLLLALAPWLDDKKLHGRVLSERGRTDRTVQEDGTRICDYQVSWAPFGRWVASCEGGAYVAFWGAIVA